MKPVNRNRCDIATGRVAFDHKFVVATFTCLPASAANEHAERPDEAKRERRLRYADSGGLMFLGLISKVRVLHIVVARRRRFDGFAGGEHCAIEYVQGGEQCRGAVSNVVVLDAFGVAAAQRQHGLGTFERLALALFVHSKNPCMLRWPQNRP
jgi:hypothetical protein